MRRLAGTVVRIAVALISVPLYTRFLGMSDWGLLMLFQAAAAPMALLDLGVGPALIKRGSEALGRDDPEAAARSARSALAFTTAMLVVGAAAMLLLAEWLAGSVFSIPRSELPRAVVGFRLVGASWAAGAALTFATNLLVSRQRYDEVLRATTTSVLTSAAFGLSMAAYTHDAVWTLLAQTLGTTLAAAWALLRASAMLSPRLLPLGWDVGELRRLLSYGGWLTLANVGATLMNWGDRWVLGTLSAPRIVGFYSVAQGLYQQVYLVFFEAAEVLFPALSHRHGMGDLPSARRLALLSGWTLSTAYGPAAATLATVGADFLRLWISPEAGMAAGSVLRLLCAGGIVGLSVVAPIFYAMGTGHSRWQAPFSILVGFVFVVAAYFLVPAHGILGLGLALVAVTPVRWGLALLLWGALFREDVDLRSFVVHIILPPLTSLAILAALGAAHDAVPHAPGWLALAGEALLVLAMAVGAQLAATLAVPGGRQRARQLLDSFAPVIRGMLGGRVERS